MDSSKPSSSPFPEGRYLPNGHRTDPPLLPYDPSTGFKFNHMMMRIRDPAKSLHFYIDLMGMRTVFTINTGPFTIYYLGYPQTEVHRADLRAFGEDTLPNLTHTLGLLELYHVHGSEKMPDDYYSTGNAAPHLGLGHLGFSVPDVPAALAHLTAHGVKIIKDLGVATRESVPLSQWEAQRGLGLGELHQGYKHVFKQIAFVRDPDGYTVELVPQKMRVET
jgi:lactoylglutathione lyase